MFFGVACDPSCTTCKPDNPSCLSCPSGYALHNGKCTSDCPDQHFKDRHDRCQGKQHLICGFFWHILSSHDLFAHSYALSCHLVCHSSCTSCFGPSAAQCTSCPGSLLLHRGECVESCGEGLFNKDGRCYSKRYPSDTISNNNCTLRLLTQAWINCMEVIFLLWTFKGEKQNTCCAINSCKLLWNCFFFFSSKFQCSIVKARHVI